MVQAFEYATKGEAAVARKLIAAILAGGNYITVWDGDEAVLEMSVNADEIALAMASTGIDYLHVYGPLRAMRLGWFMLVYGNAEDGEELIADFSDNTYCNEINAAVCAAAGLEG